MIFVTVGTQLPFDRLVRTIDEWAGRSGRRDVFAQIGPSSYEPQHIQYAPFITADDFQRRTCQAHVIIAHAGMGSIISALELGKPILVMPRRAALGEHRSEHQVGTVKHFIAQGRINVVMDEAALSDQLDRLNELVVAGRISHVASPRLLRALREFVKPTSAVAATATNDARDEYAWKNTDYLPRPAVPTADLTESVESIPDEEAVAAASPLG